MNIFLGLMMAILAPPSFTNNDVGTITGVLVDGSSGETLIGATVVIQGTTVGDATDINGSFAFTAPVGTYSVQFSYVGYNSITIQDVQVTKDSIVRLDYALQPEAVQVDEVVVEARMLRNTEAALLRDRFRSAAVSDAISADAISRAGSGDAAEAMTKVTGASVLGGRYVYIRGLGDRYASTLLNGAALPSADPDRKAFQLDLFPAALLENIVTLKTFTPDKPGDFSGGLIDVATKSFPDRFTLQVSATTTYDDQASWINNFLSYPGSKADWRGTDDGSRALPGVLAVRSTDSRLPTEQDMRDVRRGVTNEMRQFAADSLDSFAKAFNNAMAPITESVPLNYNLSSSIGANIPVLGRPLGFTSSLTYNRAYSYYDDGVFSRWQLTGGDVNSVDNLTSTTFFGANPDLGLITRADPLEAASFANVRGSDEVNWGATTTLAYMPADRHELAVTILRTQSGRQEGSLLAGFRDQSSTATFFTRALDYEERALISAQTRGTHALGQLQLEWKVSRSTNTQDEPDLRFFSSDQNIQLIGGELDTTFSLGGGNAPPPQRYFRNLSEDNSGASVDITFPFRLWNQQPARLKFGGLAEDVNRTFRQRRFEYSEGREVDFRQFRGDPLAYFDEANLGVLDTLRVGDLVAYNAGLYIRENSPARANYDGSRNIRAGYLMMDLHVLRRLRLIGGARLESTWLRTVSQDESLSDAHRIGTLDDLDLLPSLNLVVTLRQNANLRAAATRTLARPMFRELAPFQSFNFVGEDVREGNPQLERTLITNLDLRWEWFPRPGEIVAISGFYKHLDQPIERVLRTVGEGRFMSYQNVPTGRVYGLEIEARKQLNQWTGISIVRDLSLGGNLSLASSRVDIPGEELVIILASDPDALTWRRLEGQSPYLFNLNIGYENLRSGTTASLFYNVFGSRLLAVTEGATPDVFEKSRQDLNFTLSQDLPANFRIKASVKNILGSDYSQIQTFKSRDYDYIRYSMSTTFSLGLSYLIN